MPLLTTGVGVYPAVAASGTWQTAWELVLGTESGGLSDWSMRTVIPAVDISLSGSLIRLTFAGTTASGSTIIDHASIMERSGATGGGVASPVEILFSGGSGRTIAQGSSAVSDSLAFSLDETKDYLVTVDIGSANGGLRVVGSGESYIANGYDGYAVQSGAAYGSNGSTWVITKIEVFA